MSAQASNCAISTGANFLFVVIYSRSQFPVFCELVSYLYCNYESEIVLDYLVLLDTTYVMFYSM